jgi:predicted metal-dependent HD superfamily phosphohydrolase
MPTSNQLETLCAAGASTKQALHEWDQLIAVYNTPGRFYHTFSHALQVASHVENLGNPSVMFAAWFHDAVYNTTCTDNEERSAVLAFQAMKNLGFGTAAIDKTTCYILATAKHRVLDITPGTDVEVCKTFLDADLSILGSERSRYTEYSNAIRAEYSFVPERVYRAKRKEVLQAFLERKTLFFTTKGQQAFEAQARANLAAEINWLTEP